VVVDRGFVPDLLIQGVMSHVVIHDDDIIQSAFPVTLVDVTQQTVKQTHPFHEFIVLRREFHKLQVQKLLSDVQKENLWTAR
jgi:hypothetical protein